MTELPNILKAYLYQFIKFFFAMLHYFVLHQKPILKTISILYFGDRIITPATECTSPIRIQFGRSTSVATASIPHGTPFLVYVHTLCTRVYASWLPVAHSCRGLSNRQRHEYSPRGRFVWVIVCHYSVFCTAKDTLPSDRFSESI